MSIVACRRVESCVCTGETIRSSVTAVTRPFNSCFVFFFFSLVCILCEVNRVNIGCASKKLQTIVFIHYVRTHPMAFGSMWLCASIDTLLPHSCVYMISPPKKKIKYKFENVDSKYRFEALWRLTQIQLPLICRLNFSQKVTTTTTSPRKRLSVCVCVWFTLNIKYQMKRRCTRSRLCSWRRQISTNETA